MKPLCIDLFCGLGGWAEGFLSEGYSVIGFDVERHDYGTGVYPSQLVLQDVLTLHGAQFRRANVIVASPPCQAYSYRNMPWCRLTDQIGFDLARMDDDGAPPCGPTCNPLVYNDLFNACFRIAREAGVPLIVENVKGAERWVGPARWHYGSYYLWGDVPALMPITWRGVKTQRHVNIRDGHGHTRHLTNQRKSEANPVTKGAWDNTVPGRVRRIDGDGVKVPGIGSFKRGKPVGFNVAAAQQHREGQTTSPDGVKGYAARLGESPNSQFSSHSDSRKAASAQIAKIPFPLAQHIARVFK